MATAQSIIQFLKKHRDRTALIGLFLGLVIFIGVGISLQKTGRDTSEETEPETVNEKAELKPKKSEMNTEQQSSMIGTTAFFLKPSPAELLEQLKSLENLNENVVNAKFVGLKMLWSVYFFSLEDSEEKENDKKRLQADVSEDGFGVMLKADFSLSEFPQLHEIKQGQKIWIGGELLAIDPAGTGVIYILPEHVTVGEKPIGFESQSDGLEK